MYLAFCVQLRSVSSVIKWLPKCHMTFDIKFDSTYGYVCVCLFGLAIDKIIIYEQKPGVKITNVP